MPNLSEVASEEIISEENAGLAALAKAVQEAADPQPAPAAPAAHTGGGPPVPESIEDTGIPPAIIEHLILKYLYFRGELVGREIGGLLGVHVSLIRSILETRK